MPTRIRRPDIPAIASKLPTPLQKPTAQILQLVREIWGDAPIEPMVAAVGPRHIPLLKLRGKLEAEELGFKGWPQYLVDDVKLAQERWPRVFGHINKIEAVPPEYPNVLGGTSQQYFQAAQGGPLKGSKFTNLLLNTDPRRQGEMGTTVGHELLHAADNITQPDMGDDFYRFTRKLPGGYGAQSQEVRARNMGDRWEQIKKALKGELDLDPKALRRLTRQPK